MGKKDRIKRERAHREAAAQAAKAPPLAWWSVPTVIFLGLAFIVTSLSQMGKLSDSATYRYLFQDYSELFIRFRLFTSWAARVIGLVAGVGLLFRAEIFRKTTLILAGGTIALAYWKHPHQGFLHHIHQLNQQMAAQGLSIFSPAHAIQSIREFGAPSFSESEFAWVCVVAIIVTEILVALFVIFLLTRPSIKAAFK